MKNLPLLLLGAGAVYFIAKKPAKASATSIKEDTIAPGQIGSKETGYKIVNCKLTIYDKQKAFDYAFKLGAENAMPNVDEYTWSSKVVTQKLIGDCFGSEITAKMLINSKEKASFIFELIKHLYSGIVSESAEFEENAISMLEQMKNNFQKILGYDTSSFKVELVIKP